MGEIIKVRVVKCTDIVSPPNRYGTFSTEFWYRKIIGQEREVVVHKDYYFDPNCKPYGGIIAKGDCEIIPNQDDKDDDINIESL